MHTRNVSDSRAVFWYAEHPYNACSFKLCVYIQCISMHKLIIGKRLSCAFGAITHYHVSHPALTQAIDSSNSRAVIQYVERPYTTCSFWVMSVSMHKMSHRREVEMCVWIHTSPIIFRVVHISRHKMVCSKESATCVWTHSSPILARMQH